MGRGVQAFDRAMVRCVVQVRLDRNLLPCTVSGFAAPMSTIEVSKDGVPCLGVAFLICKTANGPGNHAVNYRLVIVGIGPPRTCPIPGHSRRIVRPSDSAGKDAAGNSQWGKRLEQGGSQVGGSCKSQGELSARHVHFDLLLSHRTLSCRGSFCMTAEKLLQPRHRQRGPALETGNCSAETLNCPVNRTRRK